MLVTTDFTGSANGYESEERLSDMYKEHQKTKRLFVGISLILVLVAVVSVIYAPDGREDVGYVIGAVLIIFALGAIGATKFNFKIPGVEMSADSKLGNSQLPQVVKSENEETNYRGNDNSSYSPRAIIKVKTNFDAEIMNSIFQLTQNLSKNIEEKRLDQLATNDYLQAYTLCGLHDLKDLSNELITLSNELIISKQKGEDYNHKLSEFIEKSNKLARYRLECHYNTPRHY